jgi:lysophospholipase L1-like esterase
MKHLDLHPGNPDFYWFDEELQKPMNALWINTSNDSRLDIFKYNHAEHIQDDINAVKISDGINGFEISDYHTSIDNIPTRDSKLAFSNNKKNILFAGCSMTYGSGLEVGERWVDIVFDKINYLNEYSGLFNLAQPGDSMQTQVGYIFEYCAKYGIPDMIMFNVPDFWRLKIDNFVYKIYADSHSEYNQDALAKLLVNLNAHYYGLLENFCKINGIKLISFSWDSVSNNALKKYKSFNYIDNHIFEKLIFKHRDSGPYSLSARDNLHPGVSMHKAWAEIIYEVYKYENSNRNLF